MVIVYLHALVTIEQSGMDRLYFFLVIDLFACSYNH